MTEPNKVEQVNLYRDLARNMLTVAEEKRFLLDEPLTVVEALLPEEKVLFQLILDEIRRRTARCETPALTDDEVISLFTFVYAKAAERVAHYAESQKYDWSPLGMFDGKVPLYAGELLTGYFKENNLPGEMENVFRTFLEENADAIAESNADPLILLLEALKWTWRIGIHLGVTLLEENGMEFEEF